MGTGASFDWFNFASQMFGVLFGGVLVMVANELTERRRRRSTNDEFRNHERAVYTGVFAVRNFIVERLNEFEEGVSNPRDLLALEVAQRNLDRLIEKSEPSGQSLLLVLFDVSLCLDDLISVVRRLLDGCTSENSKIGGKIGALIDSLEQFDLVSLDSLDMLSDEDIEALTARRPADPNTDQ